MTKIKERLRFGDQWITFTLHRKQAKLGAVAIDQWWMPVPDLYGQRERRGRPDNREAVLAGFWEYCRERGTLTDPEVQESYLLARLVPHVRNQGSRSIFRDSFLGQDRRARDEAIQLLERMLAGSRDQEVDEVEFHRKTGAILGPPTLSSEAEVEYRRMEAELLEAPRDLLLSGKEVAVALLETHWQKWMGSIARRAGHETVKTVLNVLSYEARAALHRAYSAIWDGVLVSVLHMKYGLSSESARFLQFWHVAPIQEAVDPQSYFHVFHGHVFSLHPAGGAFLQTPTGQELVGAWLAGPADEPAFGRRSLVLSRLTAPLARLDEEQRAYRRVLHGLFVAVCEYERHLTDTSIARRR